MALAIFGVGATGLAAMQKSTASANAHAKATAQATEIAESWLIRHKKQNINKMFENFITNPTLEKGHTRYVSITKTNSKAVFTEGASCTCGDKTTPVGRTDQKSGSYKRFKLIDNICPSCELVRRQGKPDDIKDGGITSNSGYTFRTYESRSGPTITTRAAEKEPRFQQDADKEKARKQKYKAAEAGKVIKASGVSPEYDTRGSGTVYPMSGLGNVTYREQSEYKFNRIENIDLNDSILLFNTETNTIEEATVLNIEYSYELMNVYSLNVEPIDALLTAEEGVETPIYSIFQHNFGQCQMVCCSASWPVVSYQQCPSNGSGWCYNSWPTTYDICVDGAYPGNCYACISNCYGSCQDVNK
jgi:hypothetical protein